MLAPNAIQKHNFSKIQQISTYVILQNLLSTFLQDAAKADSYSSYR